MDTTLKLIDPRDRTRIDVTDSSNVRWWCDRLNQTDDDLREAVVAVGSSSIDVLFYLNNKRSTRNAPLETA